MTDFSSSSDSAETNYYIGSTMLQHIQDLIGSLALANPAALTLDSERQRVQASSLQIAYIIRSLQARLAADVCHQALLTEIVADAAFLAQMQEVSSGPETDIYTTVYEWLLERSVRYQASLSKWIFHPMMTTYRGLVERAILEQLD